MTAWDIKTGQAQDSLRRLRSVAPGATFVVAQLGQSLDGRIATRQGDSRTINKGCALAHLHAVRSLVDAVIVGAGTVEADDPQLTVRLVSLAPGRGQPARVVIDPTLRTPVNANVFAADGQRRIAICTSGPTEEQREAGLSRRAEQLSEAGVEVIDLPRVDGRIEPQEILTVLRKVGLRSLLVEGGASTVSSFIEAGAIDRLHVLVAPLILGSGKPGLALPPIDVVGEAIRPTADVHVFEDGDVLFDCDLRRLK